MRNPFAKPSCRDAMQVGVVFVSPDDDVQLAANKMRLHDIGFLPVVDAEHRPIGALTDRDIAIRAVADDKPGTTPVTDVMTMDAVCVSADADLAVAEALMARTQKSRVMCVDDDGRLVGIVSLSDIPGLESARKSAALFAKITDQHDRRP